MLRVTLLILLVFAVLLLWRGLRVVAAALFRSARSHSDRAAVDGEMVRDPMCGTWIDRRLALAGRRGREWVPVCSEECRRLLEAEPAKGSGR